MLPDLRSNIKIGSNPINSFKRRRIAQNSVRRKQETFPAYTIKVARATKNKIGKRKYGLRYRMPLATKKIHNLNYKDT